jgi:hypothetical protein
MTGSNDNNSFWSTSLTLSQFEFGQWDEPILVPDTPNLPIPPSADPIIPLPPLLDVTQLVHLRYRREILDWRDASIAKLSSVGRDSFKVFSDKVNDMLDEVSIWRSVFSESANEVLLKTFNLLVRAEVRNHAVQIRTLLVNQLSSKQNEKISIPELIDNWPDRTLSCIQEYGFTTRNHDEILSLLRILVLGDQGVVKMFQYQIIKIAEELIGKSSQ